MELYLMEWETLGESSKQQRRENWLRAREVQHRSGTEPVRPASPTVSQGCGISWQRASDFFILHPLMAGLRDVKQYNGVLC